MNRPTTTNGSGPFLRWCALSICDVPMPCFPYIWCVMLFYSVILTRTHSCTCVCFSFLFNPRFNRRSLFQTSRLRTAVFILHCQYSRAVNNCNVTWLKFIFIDVEYELHVFLQDINLVNRNVSGAVVSGMYYVVSGFTVITARCTYVRSTLLPWECRLSVCLSLCLSVCLFVGNDGGLRSHTLK